MRRRRVVIWATLLVLTATASVATAADPPPHPFKLEIAISMPAPPPGPPAVLKGACGIAVDPTGRIFVANHYQQAVFVFSPSGAFEAQVPKEPPLAPGANGLNGPCDLAIDSAGNLYVNRWHYDVLRFPRLDPSLPTYGPPVVIDSNDSTGVAVDAADHVFVDDRTYVAEYDSTGAPVLDGGEPVRIGLGSLGDGYGVAVSGFAGATGFPATAGWVYVADAADDTVKVFDPTGNPSVPVQVIDGGGTPQLGFSRLVDADLAVDRVDGHVYVVDNLQPFFEEPEAVVDEFSSLGHYRGSVPPQVANGAPSKIVHGEPSGVAVVNHDVYLTSGNYFIDNDEPKHEDSRAFVYGPTAEVETHLLTATKTGAGAGTVFSSSPFGLGCGTACEGEFADGATVLLTAAPAAHSRFVAWSGCEPLAGDPAQCKLTMPGDRAVSAEFAPLAPLPLTVTRVGSGSGMVFSAPAGVDCGSSCEDEFDEGSMVELTAVPASGSAFSSWTGCDSEPSPERCRVTMDAARSVTAAFEVLPPPPPPPPRPPVQRILSVSTAGAGPATGTVSSEPGGIDCGSTCSRVYGDGTTITLIAHPGSRSRLLGWGGCDSSVGDRCTVTLGRDKTVVAAFGAGSPGPLKLRGAKVVGAAAILDVTVPAAGTLTASGARIRPLTTLPLAAGRVRLRVALSGSGRRALSKAGGRGLPVKVNLSLVPFDGGSVVRTAKTVAFGDVGGRQR
jgi:hypothetical protein